MSIATSPIGEQPRVLSAPLTSSPSRRTGLRTFLTVREAAFLLQRSEMGVRRMIDAGELRCVGAATTADGRRRRCLSPESVRERFPADGSYQLRWLAMGAILSARLSVPAPATRWGPPASLTSAAQALAPASPLSADHFAPACNS